MFLIWAASNSGSPAETPRQTVTKLVAQIQKADYGDDRAALMHLHAELMPFVQDHELASRVHYWRGFAMWRRALNGFNDSVDPKELEQDLKQAVAEFEEASAKDPGFVDAKIGAASCLESIIFALNLKSDAHMQELMAQARQLLKDAEGAAPESPRLLWVLGPNRWFASPERGGGQDKAMETYEKGLQSIRKHKGTATDPLEPSWGEPELLMSLAWSNLNRTVPDLNAAEQDARAALALVPDWHYVRDILMPQIRDAKAKHA